MSCAVYFYEYGTLSHSTQKFLKMASKPTDKILSYLTEVLLETTAVFLKPAQYDGGDYSKLRGFKQPLQPALYPKQCLGLSSIPWHWLQNNSNFQLQHKFYNNCNTDCVSICYQNQYIPLPPVHSPTCGIGLPENLQCIVTF